jgi:hypothetical protein
MTDIAPIIVDKNRTRAFWSLVIVLFFVPVSAVMIYLGLQPGRPDISWAIILFGVLGVLAFGSAAVRIIRTMRAPWRLELSPRHLALYTPNYDLHIPWDSIAGIAVDAVSRRPGCVLIFEDVEAVVRHARFHGRSSHREAITDARTMQARMEQNLDRLGYHLGIPGRMLEMGAEELAGLLAEARTGALWQKGEAE